MTRVIQSRRARSTGATVEIWDNRDGSVDIDDRNGWFTVCMTHDGALCSHPSLQLAREWAAEPEGWCEGCQEAALGEQFEAAPSWTKP